MVKGIDLRPISLVQYSRSQWFSSPCPHEILTRSNIRIHVNHRPRRRQWEPVRGVMWWDRTSRVVSLASVKYLSGRAIIAAGESAEWILDNRSDFEHERLSSPDPIRFARK